MLIRVEIERTGKEGGQASLPIMTLLFSSQTHWVSTKVDLLPVRADAIFRHPSPLGIHKLRKNS